jgi:hypothetical protein
MMSTLKSIISKKRNLVIIGVVTLIVTLNIFDSIKVYYLPFNIPGKQMAITIPPLGIFIESKFKNETNNPCSIFNHERVHWNQYRKMGLIPFYFNYLKVYFKSGRIKNWMEDEARLPCKTGKVLN